MPFVTLGVFKLKKSCYMGGYNSGVKWRQSVKMGMGESQWEMKVEVKLAKQIKTLR